MKKTISKIYGKYIAVCDCCEEQELQEVKHMYESFDEASWGAGESGWETKLEDGVWLNICPDCQE